MAYKKELLLYSQLRNFSYHPTPLTHNLQAIGSVNEGPSFEAFEALHQSPLVRRDHENGLTA